MTAVLSKRQQARNEQLLKDLVQSIPGNKTCADCQAPNPSWASWNLGIFLCMRCASIHRKLGTHISKVKSLNMDGWSNEQVDSMRKNGNIASNRIYNPSNKRPPVPIDADEVDSAMERHIRQKYAQSTSAAPAPRRQQRTLSTESDDTGPPLPPKNSSKFSLRSATSIFPLVSKAKKEAAKREALANLRHPPQSRNSTSPIPPRNKASKVFGMNMGHDNEEDNRKKVAKLKELGFLDARKNEAVLWRYDGNLERAVAALVKLDGQPVPEDTRTKPKPTSRSVTPITAVSASSLNPAHTERSLSPSTNPFDTSPPQPMSSQSTGNLAVRNPYNTNNPFGLQAAQSNNNLNAAFQNMSLAAPQPLFPHHTGDPSSIPVQQQVVYQHPYAQAGYAAPADANFMQQTGLYQQFQPQQQIQQQPTYGYNPFFATQQQQAQAAQPLAVNTSAGYAFDNNMYPRSPTRAAAPTTLGQIPEQAQQDFYSSPMLATNPFLGQGQAPFQQQQQQQPVYIAQHASVPVQYQSYQPPQRADTAAILALYNQPQAAPQQQQQQSQTMMPTQGTQQASNEVAQYSSQSSPANDTPYQTDPTQSIQRAATFPVAPTDSKNPFLNGSTFSSNNNSTTTSANDFDAPVGTRSRDSVMAGGMDWSSGRHSPDAFASLSARDRR